MLVELLFVMWPKELSELGVRNRDREKMVITTVAPCRRTFRFGGMEIMFDFIFVEYLCIEGISGTHIYLYARKPQPKY